MSTTLTPHGRTKTGFGGFWMPSYCPVGLTQTYDRLAVLVDAASVDWDGRSPRCTPHYRCDACGHTWSESDWPSWPLNGMVSKDGKAARP
jgi:hypothetical protein